MKRGAFAAAILIAGPACAQALPPAPDGLALSGSVRLRYETISGQARAGVPPSEASTQLRAILKGSYRHDRLTIGAELWDSRALDARTPSALTTAEVDALEFTHAWLSLDFGDVSPRAWHSRVTAGRMSLDLGSRRLIARDDYRNTINAFTGLRVDVMGPQKFDATLIYVLPDQRLPEDPAGIRHAAVEVDHDGFDARLWGGRAGAALAARVAIDGAFYRFEERDTPAHATRDRRLSTISVRLAAPAAAGRVDYEIEAMRQTGSVAASLAANAARRPVEAWFGHAEIGYQWRRSWQPHVVMEGDYASGDRGSGTYGRFDTLFGMRRADFAPAGLYTAVSRSNLIAIGPRFEVTPSPRWDAFATVKKLWLASAVDGFTTTGVVDPTGRSGRDGGWQVDGRARFWVVPKRLMLEADGTWLAKGRFLRAAPNRANGADTAYFSLNASVLF